jgi:transposase-like protein
VGVPPILCLRLRARHKLAARIGIRSGLNLVPETMEPEHYFGPCNGSSKEACIMSMPKSKARKNVNESFKVAAVQRLQNGGVPAKDLAKELGVSIWSLRRWSRQYRKKTAAGAGAAREPATTPQKLPVKPVAPPNAESGLIATIARIELEISALDKQREALKMAIEILRHRSGATTE